MRSMFQKSGLAWPLVIVAALLAASVHAQPPSKKPLLSEVIRATLEKDGADAARKRYQQIAREQKDDYEFDYAALVEHGGAYMKAGDIPKGQVLLEIAAEAAALRFGPAPTLPAPEPRARPQPRPRGETEEEAARRRTLEALGPGRTDLARFHGVYGDPKAQDRAQNYAVQQTCDGHLRVLALWGDAFLPELKSVSDTAFGSAWEITGMPHPIRVIFHTDASRRAVAMSHNIFSDEDQLTRFERLGDLPKIYVTDCSRPTRSS